jgi:hypothetical protein
LFLGNRRVRVAIHQFEATVQELWLHPTANNIPFDSG